MDHGRLKDHLESMVEALFNSRVVIPLLLLLFIVFIDHFFLRPIFSQLDILEHFLFGFIISEAISRVVTSVGIGKWVIKDVDNESVPQMDLFIRLLGFLIIGGLIWESLEYFLFPVFGVSSNPFFALPITLHNIDGTVDVTVGILGCILAWYTANRNPKTSPL